MNKYYQVSDLEETREFLAKNGYSLPYLLKLNESDRLEVGDVLLLEKPLGTPYRVKPFETADSIAKKFGTTPEKILENNHISTILPFSEIFIP